MIKIIIKKQNSKNTWHPENIFWVPGIFFVSISRKTSLFPSVNEYSENLYHTEMSRHKESYIFTAYSYKIHGEKQEKEETMNFFETRMGRRFFESTMPDVAKNLGRIADVLENNAKKEKKDSVFRWAQFGFDNETVTKALEGAKKTNNVYTFTDYVAGEMASDKENESEKLISEYQNATEEERMVMDAVFVHLTGWSMAALVRKYAHLISGGPRTGKIRKTKEK